MAGIRKQVQRTARRGRALDRPVVDGRVVDRLLVARPRVWPRSSVVGVLVGLGLLGVLAACSPSADADSGATPAAAVKDSPPGPAVPVGPASSAGSTPLEYDATVRLGPAAEFRVELATTRATQQKGLSDHEQLPEGTGMLFLFSDRGIRWVTMAGMAFPIDVAWIADDRVLGVVTLQPCATDDRRKCPMEKSPEIDAFLEAPAGSLESVSPGFRVITRDIEP